MKPGTLSGRVTSASDGLTIAGAVIAIVAERGGWEDGRPPIIVTSEADGRWFASEVPPGTHALTVTAAGFVPHTRELVVASGDKRSDVDFALDNGGTTASGLIRTEQREPIANARVSAYRNRDGPRFVAFSGADGRYQLSLAAGAYQFEVTHDDYRRTWKNVTIGDEPVAADFELIRGGVIEGQVIASDTGQPVPGAIVQAVGGRDYSTARATSDGRFALRGLHDGTITIGARGSGYAASTPETVELDTGDRVTDVQVVVDPAASIVGRVVAKNDRARGVGGATVRTTDQGYLASEVTDEDGYFELAGMLPGSYTLIAEKRGMLVELGVSVEVADSDVLDVVIEIRSGSTLSGRVEPPGVAQIGLARTGGDPFLAVDQDAVNIERARTETDSSGSFTLRGIPDGDFDVSAMSKDGRTGTMRVAVASADQSGLLVRLSPRASVAGRVIDTKGRPVADARVFPQRVDAPLATRFRRDGIYRGGKTAADGWFKVVGLEAGTWKLSVSEPQRHREVGQIEIDLTEGTERTGVTITVAVREAQLIGTVLEPDGKPAVGAQLYAMRELPGGEHGKLGSPGQRVRTDNAGSFVIDGLIPGTYTVVAESRRAASKTTTSGVKADEPVTIRLVPLSSLTIAVTHNGAPARKVHLICSRYPGSVDHEAEVVDGSHTFDDVAQGEYECNAFGDTGTANAPILVRGEPASLALALQDFASVAGTAVGVLTEQPVAGLTVMTGGTWSETGVDGRFVLERVPAGTGELMLSPKDRLELGYDKHAYVVKPGERVDLGRIKVVPPRTGEVGTYGLELQVRDDAVTVVRVRTGSPADRASIKLGDTIAAIDGQMVSALGLERAQRLVASENVGIGQTVTLTLGSGARATMTAVKW